MKPPKQQLLRFHTIVYRDEKGETVYHFKDKKDADKFYKLMENI